MGFEGEFASYEPLRRILSSEKIQALQQRMYIQPYLPSADEIKKEIISLKKVPQSSTLQPDYILAIDGSHLEGQPEKGFPGSEYGIVSIAAVLIDLKKISEMEKEEFMDPKLFRETEIAAPEEFIFPGCNIIVDNEKDDKCSLRRFIYEQFRDYKIFKEGETILETYEYLLNLKHDKYKDARPQKNPIDDNYELPFGLGEYDCPYTQEKLYSTDALRLHELMNPSGTNGELFGQIMDTIEKLWFVNILRWFEITHQLKILRRIAFVLDGPLAVFSTSSWLTKVIEYELIRINASQKAINNEDMIILGLEKSGAFFNHFTDLDISREGTTDIFPRQSAFLLTDSYIKSNIIYSKSSTLYGLDTYFGRKFFYKTASGQKIVPVLAWYTDKQKDIRTADIDQFSRLGDVIRLLDRLVSSRYPNSISPLISAHAEASIPLNLGKQLFEEIAKEIAASNSPPKVLS
ncbi:MAG: DNA double-strand break repair nuclease NurA [Treponema sp.]|jgi:hypothetical protein|nr:DNA double-strand break repair nuclease NurA [Treponema sp.]